MTTKTSQSVFEKALVFDEAVDDHRQNGNAKGVAASEKLRDSYLAEAAELEARGV